MKKLIIFLNLFVAIFFVISNVVAQVVVVEPVLEPLELPQGICVPPTTFSLNGVTKNCIVIPIPLLVNIAAPAPYQTCILKVTYNESNCGGITNIYNADFDYIQSSGCDSLEAAIAALNGTPLQQSILLRSIYRKIGRDLANQLAIDIFLDPNADPFLFECSPDPKQPGAVQVDYYEGGCVAICQGITKSGSVVRRQVSCDKNSCCITTTKFCSIDGILQPPTVVTVSSGIGNICVGATPGKCPFIAGVTWLSTSPCIASCGAPKGLREADTDGKYIYKSVGSQAVYANIYPNPVQDEINILFKKSFTGKVILYGMNGQMIAMRQPDDNGYLNFNVSNLSKGVYVLVFQVLDGQIVTEKITIQ
jgi:hypothetical protein